MRVKKFVLCSSGTPLKGCLIVWLILVSLMLQNKRVSSQDVDPTVANDVASGNSPTNQVGDQILGVAEVGEAPGDEPDDDEPDFAPIDVANITNPVKEEHVGDVKKPADIDDALKITSLVGEEEVVTEDAKAGVLKNGDEEGSEMAQIPNLNPNEHAPDVRVDGDIDKPDDNSNLTVSVEVTQPNDKSKVVVGGKTDDKTGGKPNKTVTLDRFQLKPIFQGNKCADEMKCTGSTTSRVHTLCRELKIPPCDRYREFTIFKVGSIKLLKLEEMIVSGHNGLRNRIAEKMQVGNMVELTWDDQLEQMTVEYYMQCAADVDDPCTHFTLPDDAIKQFTDFVEIEHHKWIVQNRFIMKAEFFPTNFIEIALRSWYFEKDKLTRPTLNTDEYLGITYGTLEGDNNFVHMAYPLSFRIGCSLAQIDKSYSLICNYYPFYRYIEKNVSKMSFVSGQPASFCPSYFPLKHEYFPNLCTDKFSRAAKQASISVGVASSFVIICLIWN